MNGVIGVPVECPRCAGPVTRIVTQARSNGVGTRGVVACHNGHEYLLVVGLYDTRSDNTDTDPDRALQTVDQLVRRGRTITDACNTAGIGRHHYYRRNKADTT